MDPHLSRFGVQVKVGVQDNQQTGWSVLSEGCSNSKLADHYGAMWPAVTAPRSSVRRIFKLRLRLHDVRINHQTGGLLVVNHPLFLSASHWILSHPETLSSCVSPSKHMKTTSRKRSNTIAFQSWCLPPMDLWPCCCETDLAPKTVDASPSEFVAQRYVWEDDSQEMVEGAESEARRKKGGRRDLTWLPVCSNLRWRYI